MHAVARFPDGSTEDVTKGATWSTANAETAMVTASGVVLGMTDGMTAITAEYLGEAARVDCTVVP